MLLVIYMELVECTMDISEPHIPGNARNLDMTVYLLRKIWKKMDFEAWV
jgi:hypothetical protein